MKKSYFNYMSMQWNGLDVDKSENRTYRSLRPQLTFWGKNLCILNKQKSPLYKTGSRRQLSKKLTQASETAQKLLSILL